MKYINLQGIKREHFEHDGKYGKEFCFYIHGDRFDLMEASPIHNRILVIFLAFSYNNPLKKNKKKNHKQVLKLLDVK